MTARQPKRSSCSAPESGVPAIVRDVVRTPGAPLPAREHSRFGHDFSNVRVHDGADAAASARAVHARAFTFGEHVVFGANEFAPHTQRGSELLAHELGHVAEQRSGAPVEIARMPDDDPDKLHRGSKGPETDFEGKPRSEADRNREAVHRKYYSGPKIANDTIVIETIPDMLISSLTSPRTVGVTVKDSAIKSIEWSLTTPDDRLYKLASIPGATDATTKPFTLTSLHIASIEGKYHLRCYGLTEDGVTQMYGERDFNMVARDVASTKEKKGRLTFTDYTPEFEALKVSMTFFPSDDSPPCDSVMFVQTGQVLNAAGYSILDRTPGSIDARKSGAQWSVDQLKDGRSPFYAVMENIHGKPVVQPLQGGSGRGGPEPLGAGLRDAPDAADDRIARFESCAMCRTKPPDQPRGEPLNQFYGCATWGFIANPGGNPTPMPRSFRDEPSAEFLGAIESWRKWEKTQ